MPRLLTNEELKDKLKMEYSSGTVLRESLEKRRDNIQSFLQITRDNLEYDKKERRICLYSTLQNENIYIQFPGKESVNNPQMPKDFRPKLQMRNGEFMQDASFGFIWDLLDEIGREHRAYLSYVAALFLRIGYMHEYAWERNEYECTDLEIEDGNIEEIPHPAEKIEWYHLDLDEDIWYTLNDRIGNIAVAENQTISFEAFIKFVDLLFQNEDCKYYYKNVIINGDENYRYQNGRLNSSAANLLILNYFEGNETISNLLNSFQKSRGVASFRKADYDVVTDGIVINIDTNGR